MTDFRAFYLNQRSADPTGTLSLRTRWVNDWNRRISALQKAIKEKVVTQDFFELNLKPNPFQIQASDPVTRGKVGGWTYRWKPEKVSEFMGWLKGMEERSLLEIVNRVDTLRPEGEPWSNQYIRSAYQRGLSYALDNIRQRSAELARNLGLDDADLPPSFRSTGGAISVLMNQPFHADRLALAYTRTFEELKGVTAVMDQQISRTLAEGLAQGLNPRQIGDKIADRVEKIGGTRGRLIARTEVINVHQQAALNEYYATENATGEVVLIEWNATMDSRTRDTHAERHGRVYTKEEAYALIGEPNCRCALLPYIPAVQGMPQKATQAAKEAVRKAIDKSELEEKKVEVKKEKSKKDSTKDRKSGILEPTTWTKHDVLVKAKEEIAERWGIKVSSSNDEQALEYVNKIGYALTHIENRVPDLMKKFQGKIKLSDVNLVNEDIIIRGNSRTKGYFMSSQNEITLARGKLKGDFKIGDGAWNTTDSFMGTVKHEFGHRFYYQLGPGMSEWNNIFSTKGSSWFASNVSEYGATNYEEAFAECFSAYTNPQHGNKQSLPIEIIEFFRKYGGEKLV